MKPKSLRRHILISLLLLISVAMIMTSVVMVMLMQHDMVKAEVARAKEVVEEGAALASEGETADGERLEMLKRHFSVNGIGCYRVTLGGERVLRGKADWCSTGMVFRVKAPTKFHDKKVTVSTQGLTWAVFTFSSKNLLVEKNIISKNGLVNGSVAVEKSLVPIYAGLRSRMQIVVYYGIANLLILVSLGFIRMTKLVLMPINRLVDLSDCYDPAAKLPFGYEKSRNEFAKLSRSLNQVAGGILAWGQHKAGTAPKRDGACGKTGGNRQVVVRFSA